MVPGVTHLEYIQHIRLHFNKRFVKPQNKISYFVYSVVTVFKRITYKTLIKITNLSTFVNPLSCLTISYYLRIITGLSFLKKYLNSFSIHDNCSVLQFFLILLKTLVSRIINHKCNTYIGANAFIHT